MAIVYSIVFQVGFTGIFKTILFMLIVDFILVGITVATICWSVANRFLLSNHLPQSTKQTVEWLYAFDVHCNSFFPLFLLTYVLQLVLLPILQYHNWTSLIIGNTLYFIAASYYTWITFLGYNGNHNFILFPDKLIALPFLTNTVVFLYPIGVYIIIYLLSFFGFDMSFTMLSLYFPK